MAENKTAEPEVFPDVTAWADATPELYHNKKYIDDLWNSTPQNFKPPTDEQIQGFPLVVTRPPIIENFVPSSPYTLPFEKYAAGIDDAYVTGMSDSVPANSSREVHHAFPQDLMTDKTYLAEAAKVHLWEATDLNMQGSGGYSDNLVRIYDDLHRGGNSAISRDLGPAMRGMLDNLQSQRAAISVMDENIQRQSAAMDAAMDNEERQFYPGHVPDRQSDFTPAKGPGPHPSQKISESAQKNSDALVSLDGDKKNVVVMQSGLRPEDGYIATFRVAGIDNRDRIELGEPVAAVSGGSATPDEIYAKARDAVARDNELRYIDTLGDKAVQRERLVDGTFIDKTRTVSYAAGGFENDIISVASQARSTEILSGISVGLQTMGVPAPYPKQSEENMKDAMGYAQEFFPTDYRVYVTPDKNAVAVVDANSVVVESATVDANGIIKPGKVLGIYAENPQVADIISSAGAILHSHTGGKYSDTEIIQQANDRISAVNKTAPYRDNYQGRGGVVVKM